MLEVLTAIGHVVQGGTLLDWMALGKEALDLLTQIKLYKFPHDGGKAEEIATVHRTEYPFLHDFILTENYAVFLIPRSASTCSGS